MNDLIEKLDPEIDCDKEGCGYTEKTKYELLKEFINKRCPKCGSNLLTLDDYLDMVQVVDFVDNLNTLLSPLIKDEPETDEGTVIYVLSLIHI